MIGGNYYHIIYWEYLVVVFASNTYGVSIGKKKLVKQVFWDFIIFRQGTVRESYGFVNSNYREFLLYCVCKHKTDK